VRVLRVIARLNTGGPALHVSYLTSGLRERGYDTTLVAGSLARGEGSMAYVAEERGVDVVTLPDLHREISPLRDLRAAHRLAAIVRRVRPHIIHTHTAKAGAVGRTAAMLARDARPPIVVHTFHGHVLRGYFGPMRSQIFRTVERELASVSTALVAVSPEVRDDLVALGVAPADKFTVIRLGVELANRVDTSADGRARARRMMGIAADQFTVGWIGRMTAVKRADDILLAFKELREGGVDARLCLVGDGPDRDAIEDAAYKLGIVRHCLFLGYQVDVAPFYAAFDALVLPSANEGTPVSAIEALAGGKPVVATRVGGVPDVVRDGVDGFLVEPGDVAALSERMRELAHDRARARAMGEAGRARMLERYSVDRLLDDVDALYRRLLAEKGLPEPTPRPPAG